MPIMVKERRSSVLSSQMHTPRPLLADEEATARKTNNDKSPRDLVELTRTKKLNTEPEADFSARSIKSSNIDDKKEGASAGVIEKRQEEVKASDTAAAEEKNNDEQASIVIDL